ncbi:MAG: type II toxin-antitoxin system ParD family antitoxin [Alphaproteobacteria bacterium]|nr:type II toxin-antitoxin system ParD family antitoxin [Rhizobiaceae bacterium]MBU3961096.1 type II toxin-antitoxin system ParD family antitoxin [Alphaproteobacteria bacterium]MBU4051014.1 type II toxin-antitoxin system ParD family antitoxin [Alphaproteobacteria bacterium]MBU4087737.1 type II toxin-antitoxin system ParD family antitoxin [Alphaproteobacteria bacterium]MBU4155735.1 type II toxin-antitoxin system ParD family antitoxin [Alphaproteobacteria bacterium]
MNKPVHVTIGEPFDSFIDSQVESGRFSSAEAVVEAGLRLLKEEQVKIDRLREALIESENCGPARDFDREAFMESMREAWRSRG